MHEKDAFTLLLIYAALPLYTIGIWFLGFAAARLTTKHHSIIHSHPSTSTRTARRDSWDTGPYYDEFSHEDVEQGGSTLVFGKPSRIPSTSPFAPQTNNVKRGRVPTNANVYGQTKSTNH